MGLVVNATPRPLYPLHERLGGPQGRSGRLRKISSTLGFDLRTVQPVASRHTVWAIAAHIEIRFVIICVGLLQVLKLNCIFNVNINSSILRSCDRASWHVTVHRGMWPCIVACDRASWHMTCIVTNFFVIKPTRCTNLTNLCCHETLHVLDSSSVHHQEFIHRTLSNGVCHMDSFRAGCCPARKLSTNLYDIYHCWVYSE